MVRSQRFDCGCLHFAARKFFEVRKPLESCSLGHSDAIVVVVAKTFRKRPSGVSESSCFRFLSRSRHQARHVLHVLDVIGERSHTQCASTVCASRSQAQHATTPITKHTHKSTLFRNTPLTCSVPHCVPARPFAFFSARNAAQFPSSIDDKNSQLQERKW